MQPIVPNLWFDGDAEEAAAFYVSLFEDSEIVHVVPYGPESPGVEGTTMLVEFTLQRRSYVGINGGPQFPFTEATSFELRCESQEEIDRIWAALVEGGEPGMCGWLKDRYGFSWQVGAAEMYDMLLSTDAEAKLRVSRAVFATSGRPFDLEELRTAFRG